MAWILAPAHYVRADMHLANLVAMCRAAQEYGQWLVPLNTDH